VTATTRGPADRRTLLLRAYAAYSNQGDEARSALVNDDVDGPLDAGRLHANGEARACWIEQWARTRTHGEPVGFSELKDGRNAVQLSQVCAVA
jgi:hypothetical protein